MWGFVHHRTIGMFRAGFCTVLGCVMVFDLRDVVALYRNPFAVWFPTPLMDDLGIGRPPLWVVVVIALATTVACWSAAVGFLTRTSLAIAAGGFLAFQSVMVGFFKWSPFDNNSTHNTNIVPYVLVALLLLPSVASWSVDRARQGESEPDGAAAWVGAWQVRLVRFVLGAGYLGAGVSKLRVSFDWPLGETQQAILLRAYLRRDLAISEAVSDSETIGLLFGLGAIVFEIGFVLVAVLMPIRSRLRLPLVVIGIGFHLATTLFLQIWHFLPYWAPVYLIFLTWEDIAAWRGHELGAAPETARRPSIVTGLAVAGLTVLLVVPIATAAEYWPLSDFGAYSNPSDRDGLWADRIELVAADGSARFLVASDLGDPFGHRRSAAAFRRFWEDRSGNRGSPGRPTVDPAELEPVLRDYWSLLEPELRAAYPVIRLVRREVALIDGEAEVTDRVVLEVVTGR